MAKVGTGEAAAALGKERKTLQRWSKREGCPLKPGGVVDVDELRAWAEAQGLLDRTQESGPRTATERALAEAAAVAPAAPEVRKTQQALERLDLDADGKRLLGALEADDRGALLREGLTADPKLLKKLEAVGKARAALADAVKRELDNQVRRRDLLPLGDVVAKWRGQIGLVKSAFESLPGKLAPRLVDQSYDGIYAAIESELHALLEAFAVEVPA